MIETEKNGKSIAMSSEVCSKLDELYGTYRNKLKPLIFVVENNIGKFPVQVLIEIRSYQDHIANCFLAEKNEMNCLKELNKANGHLQRAIADCYKTLMQIYYPDEIAKFYKDYLHVDLGVVNDGLFRPELKRLENIAKEKSNLAKKNEFNANGEISCTDFEDAVLAYRNVIIHINDHSRGLENAAKHAKRSIWRDWKFALVSGIIGAILSTGTLLIIQNWDAIIKLFS